MFGDVDAGSAAPRWPAGVAVKSAGDASGSIVEPSAGPDAAAAFTSFDSPCAAGLEAAGGLAVDEFGAAADLESDTTITIAATTPSAINPTINSQIVRCCCARRRCAARAAIAA